ncbi:MAG TPA: glycosyltransferase, partial [Chloroflexota bacterium]|nr:glycosyltransferase [Chloroflexota bacterium]
LNSIVRMVDLGRLELLQRRVARLIDDRGYDVVLVHPCQISQAPSLLYHLRTPSVYYCQEPPRGLYEPLIPRPYHRNSGYRRLANQLDGLNSAYRFAVRRCDWRNTRAAGLVLTNSRYTRAAVRRIYATNARVHQLGVDTAMFRPLRAVREPFVLSVGALKPEKGFDFLIASLASLPPSERLPLALVSNFEVPGERQYLQQLASDGGVEVTFNVGIADTGLIRLYNAAQLLTYAPVREPLGLAPLESLACETPVVGIDEGGVRETVIHRQTGVLAGRDPFTFGEAMRLLLQDAERQAEYGRQGRVRVQTEWNWDISTDQLESALVEVAGGIATRPTTPSLAHLPIDGQE